MLENTEDAIKNGQSRETGKTRYTQRRQTKQKHNTICVGHHYTKTNTIKVNKPSYKQLEVKTNRTSFLCRNHNEHHLFHAIKLKVDVCLILFLFFLMKIEKFWKI